MARALAIIAILAGYVVMDILVAAKLWLLIKPIERIRKARQRRRRLREIGIEEPIVEINLGTRTSTNALIGGTILSQVYVQVVTLIPGEGALEALLLQPESIAFFAVLLAAIVARFSRTPAVPGKL